MEKDVKEYKLETLVLGAVGTNVYFLKNELSGEMLIIDPADQAEKIIEQASAMKGNPVAILLTHGHYDHMLAADAVRREYQIPILCGEEEKDLLEDPMQNLSGLWEREGIRLVADQTFREEDELELAGFRLQMLHTPGHTKGGYCFYLEEEGLLFSGDTLFRLSYGRTDLPTGNERQMMASVRRLFREIPDAVRVLPGHMEETRMQFEKKYNPLA